MKFIVLLLLPLAAFSQTQPPESKGVVLPSQRFQIVEVNRSGVSTTIKMDLETGKTWHLMIANETLRSKEIYFLWVEIPDSDKEKSLLPAKITLSKN